MADLTITVDAEMLKRAHMRAIERGESVNQYLADRLREYANSDDERARKRRAAEQFVTLSREISGDSRDAAWARDELYDEQVGSAGRALNYESGA